MLSLTQCGFWFHAVGLLTRRPPTPNKTKPGEFNYAGDLAVGTSSQYIKLTDEQYGMIPIEGMEATVQGNIKNSKDGMYLQTTSIKPFGEVPVAPAVGKAKF